MIFKNLRISIRNLLKDKTINGINILGLAIGIAAIILIAQYIRFENSYDSFYKNKDRIHRLVFHRHYTTGLDKSVGNNYMAGEIAHQNIPEIENFVRCKKSTQFLQVGEEIFKEEKVFFADSSFFDLFSYPIITGSKPDFLRAPNMAVITESIAHKYFGNDDPIGKTIYRINPGNTPMIVQGVVKDVLPNSHLKFDMVISLSSLTNPSYCYGCNNTNTYFLLSEGSNSEQISTKITELALDYLISKGVKLDFKIEYKLQKVSDIHLHSNYRFEHEANGNYIYQWVLLIVALFILLSAWLNYSNIYKSVLKKKIRSFGIRKINGASWQSFASGFVSETLITGLISLVLAYLLLSVSFPSIKEYLQLDYSFDWILNYQSLIYSIVVITCISIVVGVAMSLRFLKIRPVLLIQNKMRKTQKKSNNLVLIIQFTIAIFLIASTIVALKQIKYMQVSAMSMDMDQVLTIKRPVDRKYNASQKPFEESLKRISGITETTYSTITPGEKNGWVKGGITIKGKDQFSDQIYQSNVAPGFFDFFKVKLLAGRLFYEDETNWKGGTRHVILNKQAALALGATNYTDLLGQTLFDSDNGKDMGEIVGVVDGYFQNALDQEVVPTVFNPDQFGYFIFIKTQGENLPELVSKAKAEYQTFFKDSYFEYYFLDDYFNAQYQSFIQFNRCFILFSLMAIIISILSLLGVVIIGAVARIKEIGIRKVSGARTIEILMLLNLDFIKGVAIAILIATPISYYAMHLWLENFAYKTELSWWIFALAGTLALGIALLTVSWQSWRAATRNPVEALRYE